MFCLLFAINNAFLLFLCLFVDKYRRFMSTNKKEPH